MKTKQVLAAFVLIIFISISIFGYWGSQKEKHQEETAVKLANTIKLKEMKPTTLGTGSITKVYDKDEGYEDFQVKLDNGKVIEFVYNSDNKAYNNDSSDENFDYAQYDGPIVVGQQVKITRSNYKVVGKVEEFKKIAYQAKHDLFLIAVLDNTDDKHRYGIKESGSTKQATAKDEIGRALNLVNENTRSNANPKITAIK